MRTFRIPTRLRGSARIPELAADDVGVMQRADPDQTVESFRDQIDLLVGGAKLDVQFGVLIQQQVEQVG